MKQELTRFAPFLVWTHGVGGGVGGAAQQSVGHAHLHQHGAEVVALGESGAAILGAHLALAELYHGVDHLIHFIVSERIEDLKPFDIEAALGCCGLDLVHVAHQDRRQKAVFFQPCGGLENTGVGALGVDNFAGICLEDLYQIFKHF